MRTMYDAVTARNIPTTAAMVAGYIDKIRLEPWSAADWARFPGAVKVTIVKKAITNAGHVLDVEPGDATPAQAPGWVRMRRAAGADPTVYMNFSTWGPVQAEFVRQGVAHPHYWVAKYDGVANLPSLNGITAVAKQYRGDVPPGIDINCVADYWPGVDTAPGPITPGTPGNLEEDSMITVPAGTDEHINVIVKGKTALYLACSWGRKVTVASILFYGDTGPDITGTGVGGAKENVTFLPNRPGPIAIPAGAAMATIRYTADHSFAVGVA